MSLALITVACTRKAGNRYCILIYLSVSLIRPRPQLNCLEVGPHWKKREREREREGEERGRGGRPIAYPNRDTLKVSLHIEWNFHWVIGTPRSAKGM